MVKIRLHDRLSDEQPGTNVKHFGVVFVVQDNLTMEADVSDEVAKMLVDPDGCNPRAEYCGEDESKNKPDVVATESPIRAPIRPEIKGLVKAELVAMGADRFGVSLDGNAKKAELIACLNDLIEKEIEDKANQPEPESQPEPEGEPETD